MSQKTHTPQIVNRKARFEYHFVETHVCGIELKGTEVKSIRESNVQLAEAYCYFKDGELFVRDLHITPYLFGNIHNPDPMRERKLLMKRSELDKLRPKLEEQGLTLIPIRLFFTDKNICKIEIALAKGKKLYDKRETIKARDQDRDTRRED
jgi:SsrA-binding protein